MPVDEETLCAAVSLAVVILGLITLSASRNRVLARMGGRNLLRRKGNTAIIIGGLMVGTAIISSSFVVGDTMDTFVSGIVLDVLHTTDEVISVQDVTGAEESFNSTAYDALAHNISAIPGVDGVSPQLSGRVAVLDRRTELSEASMGLFGIDFPNGTAFGPLRTTQGETISSLKADELAIASSSAKALDAQQGHVLTLYTPTGPHNLTVAAVLRAEGRAGLGVGIYVDIHTAQVLLNETGHYTSILVSNDGGTKGGLGPTAKVVEALEKVLPYRLVISAPKLELLAQIPSEVLVAQEFNGTDLLVSALDSQGHPTALMPVDQQALVDRLWASPLVDGVALQVRVPRLTMRSLSPAEHGGSVEVTVQGFEPNDSHALSFGPLLQLPSPEGPDLFPFPLGPLQQDQVALSLPAARALGVTPGEYVRVVSDVPGIPPRDLEVVALVSSEGAGSGLRAVAYVEPTTGQSLGALTGPNELAVSLLGDPATGLQRLAMAQFLLAPIVGDHGLRFYVSVVKADQLAESRESVSEFSQLFLVFGTFSIIAGVILILNIFVMLAEERKAEMGMARAIGMRRSHLKRMYLYEGSLYAAIASGIGAVAGVGIGYVVMMAIGNIFSASASSSDPQFHLLDSFTFTPGSLVVSAVAGMVISISTIAIAAHRISTLNIVAAIRDLPEQPPPPQDRRLVLLGGATALGGLAIAAAGIGVEQLALLTTGIAMAILGCALVARRFIPDRWAFSAAGSFILLEWAVPFGWWPDYSSDIEMFILGGLFLVLGALLLVVFNSRQVVRAVMGIFAPARRSQAVVRSAISYSLHSRFRTGMTISMFALVIFTITTLSMIVGMLSTNLEAQVIEQSGGYQIEAHTNPLTPLRDASTALGLAGFGPQRVGDLAVFQTGEVQFTNKRDLFGNPWRYPLLGVNRSFAEGNRFTLESHLTKYADDRATWHALMEEPSVAIIDRSVLGFEFGPSAPYRLALGDRVEMLGAANQTIVVTVIGIVDTFLLQGLFVQDQVAIEGFNFTSSSQVLLSPATGVVAGSLAKDLERAFLPFGMQVTVLREELQTFLSVQQQFFDLFSAFLGLGLIVGICGLGIITIRSVHERRQQIGMLRAIGFRRRQITGLFLLETGFIAVLGILIGTALGIFLGYQIWRDSFEQAGFSFVLPLGPILWVSGICLMMTLASTFPPSLRAGRVPPAEALRYE